MGKLLKYLFPLIFVAFFWNCTDKVLAPGSEESVADAVSGVAAYHSGISTQESEFSLPRQVSIGNTQNIQGAPRRTGGAHRSSVEFTRAGKVFNAGIRYFVQTRSVITHSSMMEPAFRLIRLGRLII